MNRSAPPPRGLSSRTLPPVFSALSFLPALLCLLTGVMLIGQAGRLEHPRRHLARPSGAWMTAREQQQQRTHARVLRALGAAALLVGAGLGILNLMGH